MPLNIDRAGQPCQDDPAVFLRRQAVANQELNAIEAALGLN